MWLLEIWARQIIFWNQHKPRTTSRRKKECLFLTTRLRLTHQKRRRSSPNWCVCSTASVCSARQVLLAAQHVVLFAKRSLLSFEIFLCVFVCLCMCARLRFACVSTRKQVVVPACLERASNMHRHQARLLCVCLAAARVPSDLFARPRNFFTLNLPNSNSSCAFFAHKSASTTVLDSLVVLSQNVCPGAWWVAARWIVLEK